MSIKDFTVLAKLGQGAYSSVYKVQRNVDSQIYALKKVKMTNLSDKQQQNALNQVRILASIHSPFVVGYKHAFIQANSLCIVMEYSDDGDLYQKIVSLQKSQSTFSETVIWKTLIQVLAGLKTLHEINILHRDLKSANVFLSKDGKAKLGDMNVSKIAKNGLLYTQTGTPYYASPQVWKDKPYDSKSDIWSLGCVIYEMCTLKPPFRAEDMDGLFKKVIKGSYPKVGDQFSKALSNVIKSMLQVNPSNRPTAAQLLKTIKDKVRQCEMEHIFQSDTNQQLLKTIRADKKLHYLTDRLPKSNYNNGHQHEKSSTTTKITQGGSHKNSLSLNYANLKNINLPKLDRIIVKNSGGYKNVIHQLDKRADKHLNENILKVQGKNSNQYQIDHHHIRYDQDYDHSKKAAQRDIRAELKKIYNLRSSPKKNVRKGLQLPKLNNKYMPIVN